MYLQKVISRKTSMREKTIFLGPRAQQEEKTFRGPCVMINMTVWKRARVMIGEDARNDRRARA
jgi:hypothetical protein